MRMRDVICMMFGRRRSYTTASRGIGSPWRCDLCGHEDEGIIWPKPLSWPPPEPHCDPRDFYDSAMGLLPFTVVNGVIEHAKRRRATVPSGQNHGDRAVSPCPKRGLDRCPFCNGEAAFGTVTYSSKTIREQNWGQDTFHSVNCISCGTSNRGLVGYRTPEDAAAHWNKRANTEVSGDDER